MKKILITGGAGFIGNNFIRYLLKKRKYKIINVDLLLFPSSFENIRDLMKAENHKFYKGDINDYKFLLKLFKKEKNIDGVINFAAWSHVDKSILEPKNFIETNVYGVFNLLEIQKLGFFGRFLQISTDEVYGDLPYDTTDKFTEDSPLRPSSPYSSSKASADLLSLSYFKTYDLDILITRSSNNFGEYQFPEKLIPLTILKIIKNQKIPVYGNGRNVRDWIYVLDNVRGIMKVFEKGKSGNIYNIGGENEITNLELVKKILYFFDRDETFIEFVKDRPGHDRRYSLDITKIKTQLDYKNIYDFEKSLKKTVYWYKKNLKWVEKCLDQNFKKYHLQNYNKGI